MVTGSAAHELARLVEEVYDLVVLHAPEVDVERLRTIFCWERPVWQQAPPFTRPDDWLPN